MLFLLLSITNLFVYIYRDRFAYFPAASYSSLYQSSCDEACVKKWKQFIYDYPASDLLQAKKIADSWIQSDTQTTINKVIKLASAVYNRFNRQLGQPTALLLRSDPLEEYKMLCASDSEKLWCGIYANMFAYFCWAENIPCRIIEIMNPGDAHEINECFIAETNQWVMVDLTTNQLLTKNSKDQLLNLLDFNEALQNSSSLYAVSASGDSLTTREISYKESYLPHYTMINQLYYYYRINNIAVYRPILKLKRYVLPVSWFEVYDEKKHTNYLFFTKQVLLFLWAVVLVMLIGLKLKKMFNI